MILGPACAHTEAQKWRQEAERHYLKNDTQSSQSTM